ncbi:Acetylornithine/succinyldiaminopimelate aminotransferase [Streptomyces griseoloalbus]
MSNAELTARWQGALMDNYGTPRLPLVRGEGQRLWDADGKEYLDFVGGIATNALGHGHPAIVEAVTRQISSLGHISNLFLAEPTVALAERLLQLFGRDGRVFFCNSGAEANEAAFKIGRPPDAPTWSPPRAPSTAAPWAPWRAPAARQAGAVPAAARGRDPRAVRRRPGAGRGRHRGHGPRRPRTHPGRHGVVVPPTGYLKAARAITAAKGALLVLDEVQTGVGRTGDWFAYQAHEGVLPDVVTLAKQLGGGLPLGATVAFGRAAQLFRPGQHGTTFGGNPVACAAGLAVLDTIAGDGLLENAKRQGEKLREGVEGLGPWSTTSGSGPAPGYRAHRAARAPGATGGSGRRVPRERRRPRRRTADAAAEPRGRRGGRAPRGAARASWTPPTRGWGTTENDRRMRRR